MHRPSRRAGAVVAGVVAAVAWAAPPAHAAPPFVYRSLVLPRHDVALDLGVGYGHEPTGPDTSHGGFGLNLEIAGSVSYDLELGFRTGVRLDGDARGIQADRYARPFETEMDPRALGHDTMANPELYLRWLVARGAVAQLGLEARAYLPIDDHFGVMFGLPLSLRLASVRFDTGLYVPIIFREPTQTAISFPLHIWIQASPTFWLGPILGLKIVNNNPGGSDTQYPFGFGLGSMLAHNIDLKAWFLFPDMGRDQAARWFGTGVALQIRFE